MRPTGRREKIQAPLHRDQRYLKSLVSLRPTDIQPASCSVFFLRSTKKATIENFRAQPTRAARKGFNRRFFELAVSGKKLCGVS
jgi:hypothetical protein